MLRLASIDLHQSAQAIISKDQKYRYWLHRSWLSGSGASVFIMLNPSTADATNNDPTIRRCMAFAQRLGSNALIVVNLYAGRATDPRELLEMDDPVGPENDLYLMKAARMAEYVICAWGTHYLARAKAPRVVEALRIADIKLKCLGHTKAGCPQHPLYIPSDKALEDFNG
jgi:hypothetical protein